ADGRHDSVEAPRAAREHRAAGDRPSRHLGAGQKAVRARLQPYAPITTGEKLSMAKQAEKERAIVAKAKTALQKKQEEAEALAEAEAVVAADDARIAEETRLAKRAELLEEFDRRAAIYVELRDAAVATMERYATEARAAYEARAEMSGLLPAIEAYSV